MKQALSDSPKFKHWEAELKANCLEVPATNEIYTRHRYNGEALFGCNSYRLILCDMRPFGASNTMLELIYF